MRGAIGESAQARTYVKGRVGKPERHVVDIDHPRSDDQLQQVSHVSLTDREPTDKVRP